MYAGPPKNAQELFFWSYHLRVSSSNWRKYFVAGAHWYIQPYTSARMSHVTCHVSHVMCHMSCVTCHVSCVKCHFFLLTKWWSLLVEGLLSMGPIPSSFCFVVNSLGLISLSQANITDFKFICPFDSLTNNFLKNSVLAHFTWNIFKN